MTTATAKRTSEKRSASVDRLMSELQDAKQQLETMTGFLAEVQKFSDIVQRTKSELRGLIEKEATLKAELSELRAHINDLKNVIEGTNNGMLAVLEPGPSEFLPLFDRMEKSDPKKHGKNATKWREHPIAKLRLSPVAANLLIDCDILFIGQLQDRVLDSDDWWQNVPGLTAPVAAAIVDKLVSFAASGGAQ